MRSDRGDLPGVVRLHAADGDERVATLRDGVGDQVFELPRLVATVRESAVAVLAFGPDLRAAERLREALEWMHRGGAESSGSRAKVSSLIGRTYRLTDIHKSV